MVRLKAADAHFSLRNIGAAFSTEAVDKCDKIKNVFVENLHFYVK